MARVILVGDDALGRQRLRRELEVLGHDVHETTDSAAAVSAARHGMPDLVITTIFMPQKEGLEVIRLLHDEHPALPIIALSAPPSAEGPAQREAARGAVAADIVQMARESGAAWVLRSPFDWVEFRTAVAELLAPARGS